MTDSSYGTMSLVDSIHPDNYNLALNETRRARHPLTNRLLIKGITGEMLPDKKQAKKRTPAKATASRKRK